jgi:hypothetical protein
VLLTFPRYSLSSSSWFLVWTARVVRAGVLGAWVFRAFFGWLEASKGNGTVLVRIRRSLSFLPLLLFAVLSLEALLSVWVGLGYELHVCWLFLITWPFLFFNGIWLTFSWLNLANG